MARHGSAKLTPALEELILEHAAMGKSHRWIADWLAKKKRVVVSHMTIGNVIRATRSARADSTKATVRNEFAKDLPRDIRILDARIRVIVRELRKVERKLRTSVPGTRTYALLQKAHKDLGDTYRRNVEMKLHFSGADEPDEVVTGIADLLGRGFD